MAERLQVVLARAGVCSRRHAEKLITQGRVKVNGKTISELGTKVNPESDNIRVDNCDISRSEPKVSVVLNKPKGVVTTSSDPQGRPTIVELVKNIKQRLFAVGRLDYQTEGLIILTNDGKLAYLLQHPKHGIAKTYEVKVKATPEPRALARLRSGIVLDGRLTAPAKVKQIATTGKNTWLEITINEGRNRQIRRMCAKIGHPVMKLKRVRYGPVPLGNLKPGSYRMLSRQEIAGLYQYCRKADKNP